MVRPLDLGIFLPNAKGGAIMSTASPPQYNPTWELNKKNAILAEEDRVSVLALDGQMARIRPLDQPLGLLA